MKEETEIQDINTGIDIREDYLLQKGELLNMLLKDKTTGKNIIWATDSYVHKGKEYGERMHIMPHLITGSNGKLIQPRAAKSKDEQLVRTRDKAEVFTPLHIIKQMNNACDTEEITESNWQDYVRLLKLEITCGEAPFIVSRYNPVADHEELIPLSERVGFLDKKLATVSKYCHTQRDWIEWAIKAYQNSYGFEWQGDSLLIARENLLYTFIDYYQDKFDSRPLPSLLEIIAEIIAWNIFQMDGLKYVVPMSCKTETIVIKGEATLFGIEEDKIIEQTCQGCITGNRHQHNGTYAKIMDWRKGKKKKFAEL